MKADGTTKGLPSANNNRTSDYMIGHFRAFKAATGDTLWDLAVDRAYELLDRMQTRVLAGRGPDAGLRDQHPNLDACAFDRLHRRRQRQRRLLLVERLPQPVALRFRLPAVGRCPLRRR